MKEYLFTIWLQWPKAMNGRPTEIIRHLLDSVESCVTVAEYYLATVAADGVTSLAWNCVEAWGV